MSGVFYEVGEEFDFLGVQLKVVHDALGDCESCYFGNIRCCAGYDPHELHDYPTCLRRLRVDNKSVYFEEVKL